MALTRRRFLSHSALVAGGALTALKSAWPEESAGSTPWKIGCFNRPWTPWTYDVALAGMKDAGFELTGLVGNHRDEPFLGPDATAENVDRLKERIAKQGLTPLVFWIRTRHDIPQEEARREARIQLDHARRLGLKFALSMGVDPPDQFEHYHQTMADAAAYAQDQGIQLVMKPHGGISAAADEMLRCVERVHHDNFRLWFDAGNILHYTGRDPVAELKRLDGLVTGFCAKDCLGLKGDVMISFGAGQVEFPAVFAQLKAMKFDGPIMVECCGGKTPEEVTAGAKANREFVVAKVEKALAGS